MSTTLRIGYLRMLQRLGKKSYIAKSVFGAPYRISIGDTFSENPYYKDSSNVAEVIATAAWVADKQGPVIFDIGGHCGFVSSQIAQILKKNRPVIYSFEPVAPTFSDLVQTVSDLSLHEFIHPIPIALSDVPGFVRLKYSKWDSMLSQIIPSYDTAIQTGAEVFIGVAQTFDEFCKQNEFPDVIKIDVEGWEVNVFRGAREFFHSKEHASTGICLEWNPEVLAQTGFSKEALYEHLSDYRFFYLNDYEGQQLPELKEVDNPLEIDFCCNLFAMKGDDQRTEKWKDSFNALKKLYNIKSI